MQATGAKFKVNRGEFILVLILKLNFFIYYRNELSEHMKTHPEFSHFICGLCRKEFDKMEMLNNHIHRTHWDKLSGKYKCIKMDCDGVFTTRRLLHNHNKSQHPTKVNCPECGKEFRRVSLEPHIRVVHYKLKPYHCTWPECKFSTGRERTVQLHIRIRHFKVPRTIHEELERNGELDPRNTNDYIKKIYECSDSEDDYNAEDEIEEEKEEEEKDD
jgi:hypothetical protein